MGESITFTLKAHEATARKSKALLGIRRLQAQKHGSTPDRILEICNLESTYAVASMQALRLSDLLARYGQTPAPTPSDAP